MHVVCFGLSVCSVNNVSQNGMDWMGAFEWNFACRQTENEMVIFWSENANVLIFGLELKELE